MPADFKQKAKKAFLKSVSKNSEFFTRLTFKMIDGCKVTLLDGLQHTAIHNQVKIARVLIDRGAPLNDWDITGYAPIHNAVRNGSYNMVSLLIKRGADINVGTRGGLETPLHLLASGCTRHLPAELRNSLAHLLFDNQVIIDSINADGNTPLFHAVWHEYQGVGATNTVMAEKLMQQGADPLKRNHRGESPLWWARANRLGSLEQSLCDGADRLKANRGVIEAIAVANAIDDELGDENAVIIGSVREIY